MLHTSTNQSIVDHDARAISSAPALDPMAYVHRCNAALVREFEARRVPVTERSFAAPPPPSPGQR